MFDMTWQDIVLGVGQLLFLVALIPSLKSADKPALATSIMTASLLTIFALVYLSLGLLLSTATSLLIALGWWTLAFQKGRADRNQRNAHNQLIPPRHGGPAA